jgi:hypothetical protein
MNESSVRNWCRMLNECRTNVHDEGRSGRPSLITEDLKKKLTNTFNRIDARLLTNCVRNSLKSLDPFTKFSASISGTKKNCAKWVPRMLADDSSKKGMGAALNFWSIITETETSFSTILSQGMKLGFPTSPLRASVSR